MKNAFIRLLDALSVSYTKDFADELYFTHPNRDNMLGLCQMCEMYGITAKGVKVFTKNIDELSIPSVLHVNGQFVILTGLTDEKVTFDRKGQVIMQNKSDFIHSWDGEALLIESDKGAIEPLFSEHRKQDRRKHIQSLMLFCLILLCSGCMFLQTLHQKNMPSTYFALIDICGIGTCCLLIQKQTFGTNKIGDKICSVFHQKDCNNILFSKKAKFYGYSWSEIGLGYFVAHFLMAVLLPSSMPLLSVVGWCAMAYGIWSVYCQAHIAKQWCALCILVQIILWANGIASIILRSKIFFASEFEVLFSVSDGIYFLSIAVITTMAVHQVAAYINLRKILRDKTYQFRSLKYNYGVFKHILHQSKYIPTSIGDSMILFGNEKSQYHITILTNPHCNPCATMHKQVDSLIERYGERLSVQYIFFAFNEKLKQSSRFLIAVFLQLGSAKAREIYSDWYESGKNQAESFMAKFPNIHCDTLVVEQEVQHHFSWVNRSSLSATPTILVNGYILPSEYDLADLPLFMDTLL